MERLKAEQQQNPSGVETHFCKPLSKFVPKKLTEDQAKLMMVFLITKEDETLKMEKDFIKVYWFYPMITKRLDAYFTYEMDINSKMLLCTWCNTPGDMVIYLTYLQYECKKRNIKEVTTEVLANIFPVGIFDRDFLHEIWDGQKVENPNRISDNLLDYPTACQSLMF